MYSCFVVCQKSHDILILERCEFILIEAFLDQNILFVFFHTTFDNHDETAEHSEDSFFKQVFSTAPYGIWLFKRQVILTNIWDVFGRGDIRSYFRWEGIH